MCQGHLIGSHAAMRMEPPLDAPQDDDTAHDMALEAFWKAVETGQDKTLKLDNRGRTSESVSQLLIDPLLTDAELLLRACHEAVNGRHGMASSLLAKFVEQAAIEYAADHARAWS